MLENYNRKQNKNSTVCFVSDFDNKNVCTENLQLLKQLMLLS